MIYTENDARRLRAQRDYARAIINLDRETEAIVILNRLRRSLVKKYGHTHTDIAEVDLLLGYSYLTQEAFADASARYQRAYEIFEERLGAESRDTLDAHCALIQAFEAQGAREKALASRRRYLEVFESESSKLETGTEEGLEDVFRSLRWVHDVFHRALGAEDEDALQMTEKLEQLCKQAGREADRQRYASILKESRRE